MGSGHDLDPDGLLGEPFQHGTLPVDTKSGGDDGDVILPGYVGALGDVHRNATPPRRGEPRL